jgi:signal transduction histidine kinase
MSLSTRIALGVALVLTLTLTVLGVTMVSATSATLTAEIDERLYTSMKRVDAMHGSLDRFLTVRRDNVTEGPADDTTHGERIAEAPDDTNAAGRDVVITIPAADERERQERGVDVAREKPDLDDIGKLLPDIFGRNVALIVVGPGGKERIHQPAGYDEGPNYSPPALPPIPSPDADARMGTIFTAQAIDGSFSYRVLMQPGMGGATFVAAESLQPVDQAVKSLVRTLVIAGLLGLAVASLVSWWVIQHGLRPVDRMVETAAAIADGDLSRRVPDADPETELGRLGEALNEMLGQIEVGVKEREAAEAKLRRFVADAAHELRTPLTSLRGYAELYRQGALPTTDAVGNAMGRIESEGARMARLVDDLLLLARTDQGRALEKEPVDLVRLAREAAGDFAAADPSRPLKRDLDGSAVVIGDPIRLRQAIDNLLTNVRIHTPPDTPARVSVQRNGSWVEVTVADEGPGIPAEDQPRIFERFWRGDPARGRTAAGGAGLGLSIVDSLVRAHGGSVAVQSAPGQGTAFTLRLPLASPEVAAPHDETSVQPPAARAARQPVVH